MPPYSLYLHIPFCTHRCGYCDFNTYAGLESLIPRYVNALCTEIHYSGQTTAERLTVHTVYFGGGTPSLLPIQALKQILEALHEAFDLVPGSEISLEANPGTLSPTYLRQLHQLKINRLSIGMQSAHAGELQLLERQHSYQDVIQAVTWARQAGYDNLNLDLIFNLPEQSLQSWQLSLELALGLHPEHLSLYALTLEHGTPLEKRTRRGRLSEPDPDIAADMYEWSTERLEYAGYAQYEISNWAKRLPDAPDQCSFSYTCQHNLQYWRNLPYLGFGAGAHGYAGGMRTANVLTPMEYIQRLETYSNSRSWELSEQQAEECNPETGKFPHTPATQSMIRIDQQDEIGETMMMGLRLTEEGVSAAGFYQRFGKNLDEIFATPIQRLQDQGLLEWSGGKMNSLRLTAKGRLLGNRVFREFI